MPAARRATVAAVLLATVAFTLPAAATSADAAEPGVTCDDGVDTGTFFPGLDDVPKDEVVTHAEVGGNCSGSTAEGLTSFTGSFTGISCGGPHGSDSLGSGTEILTWNDGSTLTWQFDGPYLDHSPSGMYIDYGGRVTASRYQGLSLNSRLSWQSSTRAIVNTCGWLGHGRGLVPRMACQPECGAAEVRSCTPVPRRVASPVWTGSSSSTDRPK